MDNQQTIDNVRAARADAEAEFFAIIRRIESEYGIAITDVSILRAPEVGAAVPPLMAVTLRSEI